MKLLRMVMMLALLGIFSTVAVAQKSDLKKRPGYIDLSEIEIPVDAEKVTEISLGPPLLRIARSTGINGDKELSETLEGIFSIQVKSFEVDEEQVKKMKPIIEKIEKKIYEDDWMRLVQVKSKDELTIVAMKYDKKMVCGLFVMSIKPGEESTFVNIVGNVDFNKLGDLNLGEYSSALDSLRMFDDDD
jgi:hypothetical protein